MGVRQTSKTYGQVLTSTLIVIIICHVAGHLNDPVAITLPLQLLNCLTEIIINYCMSIWFENMST